MVWDAPGTGHRVRATEGLASPRGDVQWGMNVIDHPYSLHVRHRGEVNTSDFTSRRASAAAAELGLQSRAGCPMEPPGVGGVHAADEVMPGNPRATGRAGLLPKSPVVGGPQPGPVHSE